jgi:hypothetical protein
MATFEHTTPKGRPEDRPPPILPEVLLVVCAMLLLPFTLASLLFWALGRLLVSPPSPQFSPGSQA